MILTIFSYFGANFNENIDILKKIAKILSKPKCPSNTSNKDFLFKIYQKCGRTQGRCTNGWREAYGTVCGSGLLPPPSPPRPLADVYYFI
jgi:hypothetical protein